MKGHRAYLVPDWVRVRAEDFGLLFYDTRSTRLTFVRSGDALVPAALHRRAPGAERPRRRREPRRRAVGQVEAADDAAVAPLCRSSADGPVPAPLVRLLDGLVAKGLLVEAEVE